LIQEGLIKMMNKFYCIVPGMLVRARRKILNRWMMVRGLAFTTTSK
jgi:hypothetical protein